MTVDGVAPALLTMASVAVLAAALVVTLAGLHARSLARELAAAAASRAHRLPVALVNSSFSNCNCSC